RPRRVRVRDLVLDDHRRRPSAARRHPAHPDDPQGELRLPTRNSAARRAAGVRRIWHADSRAAGRLLPDHRAGGDHGRLLYPAADAGQPGRGHPGPPPGPDQLEHHQVPRGPVRRADQRRAPGAVPELPEQHPARQLRNLHQLLPDHGEQRHQRRARVIPASAPAPARALREAFGGEVWVTTAPGCWTWQGVPEPAQGSVTDPVTGAPGIRLEFSTAAGAVFASEHRTATALAWWDGLPPGVGWGESGVITFRAAFRAGTGGPYLFGAAGGGPPPIPPKGTGAAAGGTPVPAHPGATMTRPGA